jgi:hypothetical protein
MTLSRVLLCTALAFCAVSSPLASAAAAIVVDVAPPAPHVIPSPPPREGYVWAPGYWRWSAHRRDYVWVDGRWLHQKRGYHWVPEAWVADGAHWRFRPGHWAH